MVTNLNSTFHGDVTHIYFFFCIDPGGRENHTDDMKMFLIAKCDKCFTYTWKCLCVWTLRLQSTYCICMLYPEQGARSPTRPLITVVSEFNANCNLDKSVWGKVTQWIVAFVKPQKYTCMHVPDIPTADYIDFTHCRWPKRSCKSKPESKDECRYFAEPCLNICHGSNSSLVDRWCQRKPLYQCPGDCVSPSGCFQPEDTVTPEWV